MCTRKHTGFVTERLMARLNTLEADRAMCHLDLELENQELIPRFFWH